MPDKDIELPNESGTTDLHHDPKTTYRGRFAYRNIPKSGDAVEYTDRGKTYRGKVRAVKRAPVRTRAKR